MIRKIICLLVFPSLLFAHPQSVENDSLRLRKDILPVRQRVELNIDADSDTYSGKVLIDLQVKKSSSSLRFHAQELDLKKIELFNETGSIEFKQRSEPAGLVSLRMENPLTPGPIKLRVEFVNDFNTGAGGLFKFEADSLYYTCTQFQSSLARQAFPCLDEPEFKIPFQLRVTVPIQHQAFSNTPVERETIQHDKKIILFAETKPLPSYLIALATGPYEQTPIPGISIPGNVITVRGKTDLASFAVETTPPVLNELEQYFGTKYPFEKLDLIVIPALRFAMENPGLIVSGDFLLFERESVPFRIKGDAIALIAHELAHMWFGDLVTMLWWDDLWLNEAFASWLGDSVTDKLFPEYNHSVQRLSGRYYAMSTDALPSSKAIRRPISAIDDPDERFDELPYQKSEAILQMVEHWVGKEKFQEGIRGYIQAHRWGSAVASDFWDFLSSVSGKEVDKVMASWIEQPGVPLLQVEFLPDSRIRLSQFPYASYGLKLDSDRTWHIPVGLKYSDGTSVLEQTVLLSKRTQVFDLSCDSTPLWLLPNSDEQGYYHWSMSTDAIRDVVSKGTDRLNLREHLGFVENLTAIYHAGKIPTDQYIASIIPFRKDPNPMVLREYVDAFYEINRIVPNGLETAFAVLVRNELGPMLDEIGLSKSEGESELVASLRVDLIDLLGGAGNDIKVRQYADSLASQYCLEPKSVDPSLANISLSLSSRFGDESLLKKYQNKFEAAETPVQRRAYISALTGFTKPGLVSAVLNYSLTNNVRPSEIYAFPLYLATADDANRPIVFDWVVANYDTLTTLMPPGVWEWVFPAIVRGCSQELLEKAVEFLGAPERTNPFLEYEMDKVSDRVQHCARLRDKEKAVLTSFLKDLAIKE